MKDSYQTPLVSICSITYNHDKYIKDAMDGFLKQETNFPFEIVISDDCSTDNTRSLLKGYLERFPDKIRLLLPEENLGVVKNFSTTIAACRGKYIALCEGDDYWTDPLKLQKQVDFMEAHPECSLCCHKVLIINTNGLRPNSVFPDIDGDKILDSEFLYEHAFIRTSSVMYRNVDLDGLLKFLEGFKVGDSPLFYFFAQKGYIGFLDELMSAYRIHDNSLWSSQEGIDQVKRTLETRLLQRKKLHLYASKGLNRAIVDYILNIITYYTKRGDKKNLGSFLNLGYRNFFVASKEQRYKILKLTIKNYFPVIYDRLY